MNTKQKIQEVLKNAGINSRQVSIREPRCGYDRAFELTIRDPRFEIEQIEDLVMGFKKVDRCEVSGEVLMGGNTWIDVEATDEVEDIWASEYREKVEEALSLLTDNHGEQIGQCSIHLVNEWTVKVWSDKPGSRGWTDYNFGRKDVKGIALEVRKCNK